MSQWDPLSPPNLPQNLHLQLPSNKRPSPSNLLLAHWKHPGFGIWKMLEWYVLCGAAGKGSSFPFFRHDVCLRGHDLIDPDSWNKAAIHSSRGSGSAWGEEFYLLKCFPWAALNVTSSHSNLLRAGTAQNITFCFFPSLITGLFLHN